MSNKIQVIEIIFEDMDNLILLKSEHKNMLQSSIDYGFSLRDKWTCRIREIHIKDFPSHEWNG